MSKLIAPPILDATCGGRMMWFDHDNPACLYVDNRQLEPTNLCDGRMFSVQPDIVADFRDLPFPDKTFHLVVFDPPHLIRVSDQAYMRVKYGRLDSTWQDDLRAAKIGMSIVVGYHRIGLSVRTRSCEHWKWRGDTDAITR